MSSKSRKHSSKPVRKRPAVDPVSGLPLTEGEPQSAEKHGGLDLPDELIHAPKETSKLRFALMIALVIFLLVIFVVPTAFQSALSGGGGPADKTYFSWDPPGGSRIEHKESEFYVTKRALASAVEVDALLRGPLAMGSERTITDEQTARFLVLDHLAEEAGVHVTDTDLVEHLKLLLQFIYQNQADTYKAVLANAGGVEAVENTIRRGLRVQRYLNLIGFASAVPTPKEIEERWNEEHEEVSFDYVQLEVEAMKELARAELPDDEALKTWFDELEEFEKNQFRTPARRTAQIASFRSDGLAAVQPLVEAFKPDVEVDPEEEANNYYNRVFATRFVKPPEEAEGEGEEGEAAEDPLAAAQQEFFSFDDVAEQAIEEAPVYFALTRWLSDLGERQAAGEEIDFAAEAAGYGLELVELGPISQVDLTEDERWGGFETVSALFSTAAESFGGSVLARPDDLAVVRVTEVLEPALPPFEEVREDAAERWVEERAPELALERLTELRDGFEEFTPEPKEEDENAFAPPVDENLVHRRAPGGAFATAAQAAGYTLGTIEWFDRANATADPEDKPKLFVTQNRDLYELEDGEVAEAKLTFDREQAFLVIKQGARPVPFDSISPKDYEAYKTNLRFTGMSGVSEAVDMDYLTSQYEAVFTRPREEDSQEESVDETESASTEG